MKYILEEDNSEPNIGSIGIISQSEKNTDDIDIESSPAIRLYTHSSKNISVPKCVKTNNSLKLNITVEEHETRFDSELSEEIKIHAEGDQLQSINLFKIAEHI